ncbi:MAG TPA: hypothetical protein PLR76_11420 [Hyphomonas sp.]|nr:hypothetical protein [Hyphomonas sp.]MCA8903870.1 hypothetical protein [Hyphomonas sp.]MCB9963000.1 hypothetical protein [Hyphomonas sp.]MCB9972349.1 hypothetical protein [Hyphomonas sp.]HPE49002.1 hypothetical protein [Hyphomonas sp.]
MTPRVRHSNPEIAAPAAPMALAILTGSQTLLSRPANDEPGRYRQSLLVRRRKRVVRRDAH